MEMELIFEIMFMIGSGLTGIGAGVFVTGLLNRDIKSFRDICVVLGIGIYICAIIFQIPYYMIQQ